MTDTERIKLQGIAENANNYVHPTSHPASMIIQETDLRFMTDAERTKLAGIADNANNYVHPASHPASMIVEEADLLFMKAAERTKLAGIDEGANKYVHPETHPATMIVEDETHRWFTDAERSKLSTLTPGGGGLTSVDLADSKVTGVLPVEKGGTGVTTKKDLISYLINAGDKVGGDFTNIYLFACDANGEGGGWIKLSDLRTKFLPTDEEFKQYLLRLPTI